MKTFVFSLLLLAVTSTGASAGFDIGAFQIPSSTPFVSLTVTPTVINPGGSSTLAWAGANVSSCVGTGFSTGGATSGSLTVSPSVTTTYSINCDSGAATASATLTVAPAPTASLTALPTTISLGNSSTLTWSSTNATSCTGTNFSTSGTTSGSTSVSPTVTTVYGLSCTGTGGTATANATVTVTAGGTLVETIQLCSTSGSTVAANTPSPPMFPLWFKKGDIPSGQYPQLQATDGTPWPVTFINIKHWQSDGSMKGAGVLPGPFPKAVLAPTGILTGPVPIPTGCTVANVLNGGTAPLPSGLTAAQMYNENILVNVNGFSGALGAGLSFTGNWQAKLANDTHSIEEVDYGDGGGGRVYRVLSHLQSADFNHGQMEVYWYVQQLLNASGGLAGYRVLPRLTQPYYNLDTPAKDWRGIQTFNVQGGTGSPVTITPPFSPTNMGMLASGYLGGNTFTITGGVPSWCGSQPFVSTCKIPGYVTTTGTLPTGLSANTIYCGSIDDHLNFVPCGNAFSPVPTITDGGSVGSTTTFHPIPVLQHFGTLWGADANGKYLYFQGSGTVATDAPIRVVGNPVYDQSTHVWPPYNMSLNPPPNANDATFYLRSTPVAFDLMETGDIPTHLDGGGERDPIGIRTGYCAKWFYNRGIIDDKTVRVLGLESSLFSNSIRDFTTHGLLNLGDPSKSYTGMSSATNSYTSTSLASTFKWGFAIADFGAGGPLPAHGGQSILIDSNDTSHMPDLAGCAYLATGEPQYLDLQAEWANDGIYTKDTSWRNTTLNSINYYGITTYYAPDAFREMIWGLRPMIDADSWWPDTDPAGTQLGAYFHYQEQQNTSFMNAVVPLESTAWARNNCYWMPPSYPARDSWMLNYVNNVLVNAYNSDEDSNAFIMLQCNATWYQHVLSAFSSEYLLHNISEYPFDVANVGNPVTLFRGDPASFTCSSGTVTMTATPPHLGLYTGQIIAVNATGYTGNQTITRTGVDTATFAATCAGSVSGNFNPVAQLNASDDTFGSDQTDVNLDYIYWLSGTPGSFSLRYYDYSAGSGPGGNSWNPTNGDKFIFKPLAGLQAGVVPGGLLFAQPYYTVNTHFGQIANSTWNSGILTVNTSGAHGITLGTTVSMGITGNAGGMNLNCVITTTTQFTCPLGSDPGPSAGGNINYNTSQLSDSKGGTPLAITDTNNMLHNFSVIPANPPASYWVDYPGNADYPANAWGAANAMKASGITGLDTYIAAVEARLLGQQTYFGNGSGTTWNTPPSTRAGTFFQTSPKNAMQSTFGSGTPPTPPSSPGGHRLMFH